MKYKVGDKVKIKTRRDMKSKYGVDLSEDIHFPTGRRFFTKNMEEEINGISPDRILTIKRVMSDTYYLMEEIKWDNCGWNDYMIECLAEDYIETIPITNRFEILDL